MILNPMSGYYKTLNGKVVYVTAKAKIADNRCGLLDGEELHWDLEGYYVEDRSLHELNLIEYLGTKHPKKGIIE